MSTRYLTVTELKAYVRTELVTDDSIYEAAINTAEEIIDTSTGRQFVVADPAVSSARVYKPSGGCVQLIDDAAAIVSVVDNGATLTSGVDYQAEPLNGMSQGRAVPYFALRRLGFRYNRWYNWYSIPDSATITVTARWGWAAIPALVKESCKIIAKDVFNQRNTSGFGLVAITEAGGVGTRENAIVQKMVYTYQRPDDLVP